MLSSSHKEQPSLKPKEFAAIFLDMNWVLGYIDRGGIKFDDNF